MHDFKQLLVISGGVGDTPVFKDFLHDGRNGRHVDTPMFDLSENIVQILKNVANRAEIIRKPLFQKLQR